MIDARIFDALDIPRDADVPTAARCLRRLLGVLPATSSNPDLWRHFLYEIQGTLQFPGGNRGDGAELANNVVGNAIANRGDPDEHRRGYAAWDRELGVSGCESDEVLREFVVFVIAPRLAAAELYALL